MREEQNIRYLSDKIIWHHFWPLYCTLLEEKVLYRTLKGSISAKYLEPPKGSIQNLFQRFNNKNPIGKNVLYGTFWVHSLAFFFFLFGLNISYY